MKRANACCCALALAMSVAIGTSFAQPPFDANAAKGLFEAHCSPCHPLDRSLRKTKDRTGWQKTVDRMKSYSGSSLADAEAQTIVEYLSRVRGPAKP